MVPNVFYYDYDFLVQKKHIFLTQFLQNGKSFSEICLWVLGGIVITE